MNEERLIKYIQEEKFNNPLGGGRAEEKGVTEKDVNPKQLKMGVKVEMEHTTIPEVAKEIALDHLAEIPDYYTRLEKMEKDAGVDHHGEERNSGNR